MCRHIIITFDIMLDEWHTLRYDMIEETLKIQEHRRISIFINGNTSRGVLDKYRHNALIW